MNLNEVKKDLIPEFKKKLGKSNLQVLTNENDFLVKNLKKAGWSTRAFKYFSNNKLFKLPFKDKIIFLEWLPKKGLKSNKYKISIKYIN